ncbi:MAG: glycerol-3-phosphate 1-O-acyltransferase PlsY [Rhodobacteraceae bacterium]|nr:glycerol-3-phosphate 1-O-acyltransferase PlsY [Paracoccaceae bacterium]
MPELLTPLWLIGVAGLLGYVLGSVAFGPLVARAMGLGDLRGIGSGNIGATNVLRTGSKAAAALTLVLDGAKGAVAVGLGWAVAGADAAQAAGLAAFLGHIFPVFLAFKGGKGVATWLGVALALAWPVGLAACALWAAVFALTRISSLSALVAAALAPGVALVTGQGAAFAVLVAMAALIFWSHRGNIARLFAGTEPRFGRR